jgi:hypothetical protein
VNLSDLFFDFSGPQEAWPSHYFSIMLIRLCGLAALIFGTFFLKYRAQFAKRTFTQRATLVLILISVSMAADYILFQVSSSIFKASASGNLSIHYLYGATAATIFTFAEVAAVIDLVHGRREFMKQILPPILYLFVIGIFAGVVFDNYVQLFADSGRAAILLVFSYFAYKTLPS